MIRVESYAGTDLSTTVGSEKRLVFWLVSGLDDGQELRGVDTVIPGTAGRTARSRVLDRRVIEIQGWVRGTGGDPGDDLRDAMETLRSLFDPTRAVADLVVLLEDQTRTATISCRPLPDRLTNYPDTFVIGQDIRFEAIGADWAIS